MELSTMRYITTNETKNWLFWCVFPLTKKRLDFFVAASSIKASFGFQSVDNLGAQFFFGARLRREYYISVFVVRRAAGND